MRPIALVTGASSGIGEALARRLAPDHDLVLVARRRERLEALAAELAGEGRSHRVVPLDLSRPGVDLSLFAEVPSCDLLVNNVGYAVAADVIEADPGELAAMLEVNVRTLVMLTRRYLPGMVERRSGGVLHVASLGAFFPTAGMAAYSASKSFVLSFSEAVRQEVLGTGVKVSCVCPGPTETEFMSRAGMDESKQLRGLPRGAVFQSADTVAGIALSALRRNKPFVVTGVPNKLATFGARFSPRSTTAWIVGKVMRPK